MAGQNNAQVAEYADLGEVGGSSLGASQLQGLKAATIFKPKPLGQTRFNEQQRPIPSKGSSELLEFAQLLFLFLQADECNSLGFVGLEFGTDSNRRPGLALAPPFRPPSLKHQRVGQPLAVA